MSDHSLHPFLSPLGVVVIGASQNPAKLGYSLARNLIQSHYTGAIHLVNPGGGSLLEHPFYPSVLQVPDPVDLAVMLVPAAHIPPVLRECGQRGIQAAVIASGGFRETGAAGWALEQECLHIAREMGIRLIGPNCVGLLNTHLPINTTFLPPPGPTPGETALLSHSGAMCMIIIDWARLNGFGLSQLVSLGNQVDVNETDLLAPIAADPYTRVLTLYLEEIGGGRRFVEEARRVGMEKPIVALKSGRSASGKRAAASHTGALAGEDFIFSAVFEKAGIIRANTTEELLDWARALAWCPLPQGRSAAILGNAGGPGVAAADALEAHGLHLAELQEKTHTALGSLLPAAASLNNPVDMLASASPEQYAACLETLLGDPEVQSVLVILPPLPSYPASLVALAIIPIIQQTNKPVVIALVGGALIQEAAQDFRQAHIPEYRFPENAVSALAVLAQRAEYLAGLQAAAPQKPFGDADLVRDLLQGQENGWLPQEIIRQVLAAYGIPCPQIYLAHSTEEALCAFRQIMKDLPGSSVVLKIASQDILHKSDVGGVALNLSNDEDVLQAYQRILRNVHTAQPQAKIDGIFVQPMLPAGQDTILGTVQDAQFGAVLMFGSGGVEVEGLKDVAFSLAPLSPDEAGKMLESTWAGRKLKGYRNLPAADRQAVLDSLVRIAQLAVDFPQLKEIEINPLRVLPSGQGVFGIDTRIRLEQPS